jgi:hypothetical protein
MKLQVK